MIKNKNMQALEQVRLRLVENKDKPSKITSKVYKKRNKEFGFIKLASGKRVKLNSKTMKNLMNGDVVEADLIKINNEYKARISKVVERHYTLLNGYVKTRNGKTILVPEEDISQRILIDGAPFSLRQGDFVSAKINRYPSNGEIRVYINELIVNEDDPKFKQKYIKYKYKIDDVYNYDKVDIRDIDRLHFKNDNRVDLTDLDFVTIDSEGARDLDDAIYVEKLDNGNWRVYVAISDASHYIKEGSSVDKDALRKGMTAYINGDVTPMFSSYITQNFLSLVANLKRKVFMFDCEISSDGEVSDYKFYEATIRVSGRLTYNDVTNYIDYGDVSESISANGLELIIQRLYHVYGILNFKRRSDSLIVNHVDYYIAYNENNTPIGINKFKKGIGHKIVEEVMVLTNKTTGEFLKKNLSKGIFRNKNRIKEDSTNLMGCYGIDGDIPISDYIEKYNNLTKGEKGLVNQIAISSSLERSVYGVEPKNHFTMGINGYSTFTSPIRKYTDIINHRVIKGILGVSGYHSIDNIEEIAGKLNEVSQKIDGGVLELERWSYRDYLKSNLQNVVSNGRVVEVSNHEVLVNINDTPIVCKVLLDKGKKEFDVRTKTLKSGRRTYTIGDEISFIPKFFDDQDKWVKVVVV